MILRLTGRLPEESELSTTSGFDKDLLEKIVRSVTTRELAKMRGESVATSESKQEFPVQIDFVDEQIRAVLGRFYPQVKQPSKWSKGYQVNTLDEDLLKNRVRQEIYRLVYKDAYRKEAQSDGQVSGMYTREILEERVREVFFQELRVLLGGARSKRTARVIQEPDLEALDQRMREVLDWCLARSTKDQIPLSDDDIEHILRRGLG
jgi:hypothetical protein